MIGEDFRSQAMVNYYKVIELQDKVLRLESEPIMHKHRYLQLWTKYRRLAETNKMELEDIRVNHQ